MLRRNSKEVKRQVREYIKDWLYSQDWETLTDGGLIDLLEDEIEAASSPMDETPYSKIRTWLEGGNIEAYNEPCWHLLKEWYQETEEEAKKFSYSDAWYEWLNVVSINILDILKERKL